MGITSWGGAIPQTAAEVASLQTAAKSLSRNREMNYDFFQDTILRLISLRDQIKNSENIFYKVFNIPSGAEGLRILQQRFNELNLDFGFRSMSNLSDSYFDELVVSALNNIDLTAPVNAFFENETVYQELVDSPFGQEQINIAVNTFIDGLNNVNLGGARIYKSAGSSNAGMRGLSKYIGEIKFYPKETKEKRLQITFIKTLPSSWQNRLKNQFGLILDNKNLQREKILENWLMKNINNPKLKYYVLNQFQNKRAAYDLNNSSASIKGFLGEVRTAAFLDYLCNRKNSAIPTGNIHEIINGQLGGEIAIDILLKGFGFQVKNYRVSNSGNATFMHRDSMGMGNFIVERMRPENGISQILQSFFGSWAFNQPVENATDRYQQIYSRFGDNGISEIFEGYIDNILKVSDEFQADMKFFSEKALYFNTFFIIGDKIVPSSAILTGIINSLSSATIDKSITSSFSISAPSGETEKWNYDNVLPSSSTLNLANATKVSWIITINLNSILNQAYMSY